MDEAILAGATVLLLEDEFLINLSTAEMIEAMGCTVLPFMHLNDAKEAVKDFVPDLALLDVNVEGVMSYELAEGLKQRNVPIIFLTGYGSPAMHGDWRDHPVCRKPCKADLLKELMITALRTGRDLRL